MTCNDVSFSNYYDTKEYSEDQLQKIKKCIG